MKKSKSLCLTLLFIGNWMWAQCPSSVLITGSYTTPVTNAFTSISSTGITTIPSASNVTLDVNPSSTSFILLDVGFQTQASAVFLATILTPCTLGIDEMETEMQITLFPNPVRDVLYFESNEIVSLVTVFDVNGRLIAQYAPKESNFSISTNNLQTGVYFVRSVHSNKTSIKKILKY